jgi:hypothetical protein
VKHLVGKHASCQRAPNEGAPACLFRSHVWAVPRIIPARVADIVIVGDSLGYAETFDSSAAFASPKSSTLTTPAGVTP